MPCRSEGDERPSDKDELDTVTTMLCAVMGYLETNPKSLTLKMAFNLHPELRQWWRKHQAFDKERLRLEAEEATRLKKYKTAVAKLTREEQKLLGIKI